MNQSPANRPAHRRADLPAIAARDRVNRGSSFPEIARVGSYRVIPHPAIKDTLQGPSQRASGPEKRRDAASTLTNGTSQ